MIDAEIINKIQIELESAHRSRAGGNQGRARVSARRAAGWAIQEYFHQNGIAYESSNAFKHLKFLAGMEGLSDKIYEVLNHLTIKLEKDSLDQEAYYPIQNVDLIEEAHWLAQELLQTTINLQDHS